MLSDDRSFHGKPHPYLSAATRKVNESGHVLLLDMGNWQDLEAEQSSISVSQKLVDLLQLISKHCRTPGQVWLMDTSKDYPLIAAHDKTELESYLDHLHKRGLLHKPQPLSDGTTHCQLTIAGWEAIEPTLTTGGIPGRCFVAMSFDPSLDGAWQLGIKPAILDCGFTPVCMKEIATNEGITDRILSEIRLAQFVVADFTGQRGGVYFEAGFARGLGRDVIWTCRNDELDLLHFDTKHLGHVVSEEVKDLRAKLAESIRANIIPKR